MKEIIALAIAGASIAFASPAAAYPLTQGEENFVNALYNIGVYDVNGDVTNTASVGWLICGELYQGTTFEQAAAALHYQSAIGQDRAGVSIPQARRVVQAATLFLCPSTLI